MKITKREIAECVGLWLAEGDNKTRFEVTFTNNCFELIKYFHQVMKSLYGNFDHFRPRLYSYSKDKLELKFLANVPARDYIDIRARKPYYIYRFSSVSLTSEWKALVNEYKEDHSYYIDLLRGFFAGEGNIKTGSKYNRVIRIAQKNPSKLIDDILIKLSVNFSFRPKERSYSVWGRESWDKLAEIDVSGLHPIKKVKFCEAYNKFKEYHYSANFLRNSVYELLINSFTTKQLSSIFKRTPARLCDVLMELKKEE